MDRMGGVGRTIPQRQDSNTPVGDRMSLSQLKPSAALEGGGVTQVAPQTVPTGGGASRSLGEKVAGFFQSLGHGLSAAFHGIKDMFAGLFTSGPAAPATATATATGGAAARPTKPPTTDELNAALVTTARTGQLEDIGQALLDAAKHAGDHLGDTGGLDKGFTVSVMGKGGNHLSDDDFGRILIAANAVSQGTSKSDRTVPFLNHVMSLPKPSERALADLGTNLRNAEANPSNALGNFMRLDGDYSRFTAGLLGSSGLSGGVARTAVTDTHAAVRDTLSAAATTTDAQELKMSGATAATAPVMLDVAKTLLGTLLADSGPGSARSAITPEARAHLDSASQAIMGSALSAEDKTKALNTIYSDAVFLRVLMPDVTTKGVPGLNLPANERTLMQSGVNLALSVANNVTNAGGKMSADLGQGYTTLFADARPKMEALFVSLGRPTDDQIRASVG